MDNSIGYMLEEGFSLENVFPEKGFLPEDSFPEKGDYFLIVILENKNYFIGNTNGSLHTLNSNF